MANRDRSKELFKKAKRVLVGGVNSPVRAFKAVGGTPPFIASGKGSKITDEDGNKYIDYVGSWGPLILGHGDKRVKSALREATQRGTSFGAPTKYEVQIAESVSRALPSVQKLRFVNSGTEATMSALRLARGVTGRKRVLKFEGCYHGHADSFLVGAGSGVATLGIPDSPGVPEEIASLTIQTPFNDLEAASRAFKKWGKELACVIVEPIAGNMGCVLPVPGFLRGLRELCDQYGSLLIFDEVMTGFRVAWGGAQKLFRVKPDLTCLGKVIGGGLPAAAYGGRRDLMNELAPEGPVYQAGTLSGNPLAMAAGLATLEVLKVDGVYDELEDYCRRLCGGLTERANAASIPLVTAFKGGMFGFFFKNEIVRNFTEAKGSDMVRFANFHRQMLGSGIYLAPSAFEAGFVSLAHTKRTLEGTLKAATEAFRQLRRLR